MEREEEEGHYEFAFYNSELIHYDMKDDDENRNFSNEEDLNYDENSSNKKCKKNLENQQISCLFGKKTNIQRFIETIGENAFQPIRPDILDHCQKLCISIPSNLSKETIMKLVKNRVDKMIKNKRIKKNWSEEDIKILVWVISKYCQYHGIIDIKDGMTDADWTNIADLIPGVSGKSCMFKWLSLKKNNLAENSWIQEESLLLDEMVKKYGEDNWCRVSQELFLKNPLANTIYRCPKQCRQHWNCYLNPQLKKGPWDKKEDYLLLRAVLELQGVKKWAQIVKMFNGRTQNALKNRFNLIVQKQIKELKCRKKLTELQIVQNYLKKHENQHSIEANKLQFLSQKRQFLNENQLKKKPKKTTNRRKRQYKISSQQEYMPDQNPYRQSRKSMRNRTVYKQTEQSLFLQAKHQQILMKQQSISINPVNLQKREQLIFEQDDEFMSSMRWQKQSQTHKIKKLNESTQQHTNQQVNIQHNGVYFVPFSDQVMKRLRNHTLIPCRITESNQIVELRMAK